MSNRRFRFMWTVGAIAVACVVAATAAAAEWKHAALAPYKVMIITGVNSGAADNNPTMPVSVSVAEANINKHGGIGGHPLQAMVCNHQGSSAIAIQCAQTAIDQHYDNVIGINTLSTGSTPLLTAAGIPAIATTVTNPIDYKAKGTFPLLAPGQGDLAAAANALVKKYHLKRIAFIGQDTITGSLSLNLSRLAIRHAGGIFVGNVAVSPTTTDWAPWVQRLKELNPDGIVMAITNSLVPAFLTTARQLGLNQKIGTSMRANPETSVVNYPNAGEGLVMGSPLPDANSKFAGVKRYISAMTAAGQGSPDVVNNLGTFYGWLSLYAIQDVAKRVKGPITKASMVAAARAATSKNPIDLFGIFKWAPGDRGPAAYPDAATSGEWVYAAKGGKFTLLGTASAWQVLGLAKQ